MKQTWFSRIVLVKISFIAFFISSCAVTGSKSPYVSKNTGDPGEPTRQINRVDPPRRDHSRYLDSGAKKKKKWTKISPVRGMDCPWAHNYKSSSEEKIKSKLNKNKRKLK